MEALMFHLIAAQQITFLEQINIFHSWFIWSSRAMESYMQERNKRWLLIRRKSDNKQVNSDNVR